MLVIVCLATIGALSWTYLFHLASAMPGADMAMGMGSNSMGMSMPNMNPWQLGDIVLTFMMWSVMMIAMMSPSAAPMTLMFARVHRERHRAQSAAPTATVFLLGYLALWTVFSAGATLLQHGLHAAALLSPQMMRVTPVLGGVLLLAAGVYQFTPLKRACLSRCRTPLGFLIAEWRDGMKGALVMGWRHGMYCVGCCWLLMTLLFVAGVMNLLWVALIALSVLAEKVIPNGEWVSRIIGLISITWGGWLLVQM
ncbi:MAG: DUF2182 domain-containing protein [Gemmatimonadaceae bacterium]